MRTRAMVQDIKEQVLAELEEQSYPSGSLGTSFQAYCQLVDAIREEVLLDLKKSSFGYPSEQQLVEAVKGDVLRQLRGIQYEANPPADSFRSRLLSPAEIETIKKEVVFELQKEQESNS